MNRLEGRIAVVAGASRGAGRGIALALADRGATVYVAGRTVRGGPLPPDGAPGTIDDTADEVRARGGVGIPIRADCTAPADVAALFERVAREQGRVDVLANAVWGASDVHRSMDEWMADWSRPFWLQDAGDWPRMISAGPYAYYLATRYAVPLMIPRGGLIVGVTDGYLEDPSGELPAEHLLWRLAHTCINELMLGIARQVRQHGIAVVTLMPGFMRTERIVRSMTSEELRQMFKFDRSESTEYVGRVVAALASDPDVMAKTGKVRFVADLAREYGVRDVNGRYVPRFSQL